MSTAKDRPDTVVMCLPMILIFRFHLYMSIAISNGSVAENEPPPFLQVKQSTVTCWQDKYIALQLVDSSEDNQMDIRNF